MWELNYKESWVPKNWCFWTVVLEKTLFFFKCKFIYFNWRLITLQYYIGFAIHWHGVDSCQCIGFLSKAQSRLAGGQGCASRQESGPLGSAPPPPSGARRAVRLKRLGRIYRHLQAEAEPAGFRNLPVPPHSSLAARFRFLSRDERRKLAPEGAAAPLTEWVEGCAPGDPPILTHLGIIFALWDSGVNLDPAGVGRGLLGILYESLPEAELLCLNSVLREQVKCLPELHREASWQVGKTRLWPFNQD